MGNIGHEIKPDNLRGLYLDFGKVTDVIMKGKYAFVEFENRKDADEAIKATNGVELLGFKLQVEWPKT